MQIKKYTAPTLKEAITLMKNDLGEDAIILSTRMTEDKKSPHKKKLFEVTASVEDSYDFVPQQKKNAEPNQKKEEPKNEFAKELEKLSAKFNAQPPVTENNKSAYQEKKNQSNNENNLETELKEIYEVLIHREVSDKIAASIINQLRKYSQFLHTSNIDNYVTSTISSMIPTSHFEVKRNGRARVIAFVGPTGVGKSTSIAKLAVISKLVHNLDVGLITLDTYRLGALDQLRIFSEISKIDMHVAYEAEELPELFNKFKKKDIIFIDTAGRSQNNKASLKEMEDFLSKIMIDETYLVLSSTSSTKTLFDAIEKFKLLNYNGLIFSKIDEAAAFGNILNVSATYNIPIKYITNGQIIPDDIIAANAEFIANMIYTGNTYK